MTSLRTLVFICAVAALLVGAYVYLTPEPEPAPVIEKVQPVLDDAAVEAYVRSNISALSPEPEQVGGTFYVTSIEVQNGTGKVSYEDGHNAYMASFTYEAGADGAVKITEFVVE